MPGDWRRKRCESSMNDRWKAAVTWAVVLGVIVFLYQCTNRDDTDPESGRSGFQLMTDEGTGCQYLRVWPWDFHPRLDEDGKHMCTQDHKVLVAPPVE